MIHGVKIYSIFGVPFTPPHSFTPPRPLNAHMKGEGKRMFVNNEVWRTGRGSELERLIASWLLKCTIVACVRCVIVMPGLLSEGADKLPALRAV